MAQTLDTPLELDRDILAPSTHPEVTLNSEAAHALNAGDTAVLGFAPAPTVPADSPVASDLAITEVAATQDRPAPLARPRRRFRMDWYEMAVIGLILACGALCVYRLMWAIQP